VNQPAVLVTGPLTSPGWLRVCEGISGPLRKARERGRALGCSARHYGVATSPFKGGIFNPNMPYTTLCARRPFPCFGKSPRRSKNGCTATYPCCLSRFQILPCDDFFQEYSFVKSKAFAEPKYCESVFACPCKKMW